MHTDMNITIITSQLPYPLVSGGAQAQFNIVDLLRKEHHFTILFPVNQKNSPGALSQLQALWPEVTFRPYSYLRQLCYPRFLADKAVRAMKLKLTPRSERFQVERILKPYGYYPSRDFVGFVNSAIRDSQADIVQVDFYPYLHLINYLDTAARKVFVQHEIRYIRNKRILAPFRLNEQEQRLFEQLKNEEIANLNRFDHVITLTEVDQRLLAADGVTQPITVSPAAVSTPVLPYERWNGRLTFIGGHGHIPNKEGLDWFLDKVLPLLPENTVQSVDVIGSGWPQDYATRHPRVRFLGFVEDLTAAVHDSILMVPILTGSGMRMKILDAAAMSVPFVTTSVGVEGLSFAHEQSCLVADTPEAFAAAITRLCQDARLRETVARGAHHIFEATYSREALARVRNHFYCEIIR